MKKIFIASIFSTLIVMIFGCAEQKENNQEKWENAKLVWSDEFEGESIDTTKWVFERGAHGWGNNEWQDYKPLDHGNATVSDGKLHITVKLEGEGQQVGDYTSARMNSTESFTYGRMEVRAKIPDYEGEGIWPAIWMLGENIDEIGWPNSGEIDIMEYVSYNPDSVVFSIHSVANNHRDGTQVSSDFVSLPTIEEEFHNYGILWEEEVLHFYIDEVDNVVLSFERPEQYNQDNWPFDKPFYFLMNIAVGGDWGGLEGVDDSIFPATMDIEYVRVWQLQEN
jgi:beta-glucanase (GH16 family)